MYVQAHRSSDDETHELQPWQGISCRFKFKLCVRVTQIQGVEQGINANMFLTEATQCWFVQATCLAISKILLNILITRDLPLDPYGCFHLYYNMYIATLVSLNCLRQRYMTANYQVEGSGTQGNSISGFTLSLLFNRIAVIK